MRRLLVLALLAGACNAPPDVIEETAAPLYVDVTTGHGPMACSGPIPGFAFADAFTAPSYGGTCSRWRADFDGGSQWQGYDVPGSGVRSIRFSPQYTAATLCFSAPTGPSYAPCAGQRPAPAYAGSGGDVATMPFPAAAILLKVYPLCPSTPRIVAIHRCAGVYTPEDGSGYVTAVLSDGFPAPGLPFGHPLNLPNAYSLAGDCIADTAAYGLPFTPPTGYPYGTRVAAVYTCP